MVRDAYNFTSTKQKNSMSRIKGDFYVPKEPDFQINEAPEIENTIYSRKDNTNFNSVRDNRKSMKEQVHLWNHLADPE